MNHPVRWGILGTGHIAHKFATGLAAASNGTLAAVGSRKLKKAESFAAEFGAPRAHGSYEALASDPEVDVIYVSSPHNGHMEHTLLCVGHGKAVLCEKPFAINADQARAMVSAARQKGVFLMEAMWTRFLPAVCRVRSWIAEGRIGEVRMVNAAFGFRAGVNPGGRLFNLANGGGGLLDVGIYPISLAAMAFGAPPERVTGFAQIGETGVDEQNGAVLGFPGGGIALIASAVRTNTQQEAHILGTDGRICIHGPFWVPTTVTLSVPGREETVCTLPYTANGFTHEAEAVGACLLEGRTECDVVPLDESVALMESMDALRAQWGLKYPMEQ